MTTTGCHGGWAQRPLVVQRPSEAMATCFYLFLPTCAAKPRSAAHGGQGEPASMNDLWPIQARHAAPGAGVIVLAAGISPGRASFPPTFTLVHLPPYSPERQSDAADHSVPETNRFASREDELRNLAAGRLLERDGNG